MRKDLKTGLLLFRLFLFTGILPLVITAIGTVVFPYQSGEAW
jgi:K+-transporting ATPase c subunit